MQKYLRDTQLWVNLIESLIKAAEKKKNLFKLQEFDITNPNSFHDHR